MIKYLTSMASQSEGGMRARIEKVRLEEEAQRCASRVEI
jgi:hypothetical protein